MSFLSEDDVAQAEDAARRLMSAFQSGNARSEIHVNAGGVGVWIATTACMVMVGVLIVGALWVSREFARYDAQITELRASDKNHTDYLAAIYMQAPHLKPVTTDAAEEE